MNKKDVKTKEDIEQYYSKCRKIKFSDNIKPKDIKEIFELIKERSPETLFKTGSQHCGRNRTRSIDDYIKLCKYYFPDTPISEVIQVIEDNISSKKDNRSISIAYCGNIKKENIRYNWYITPEHELEKFKNRSFSRQGFPNCGVTYKELV